jgi:hypothetical protein
MKKLLAQLSISKFQRSFSILKLSESFQRAFDFKAPRKLLTSKLQGSF